MDEPPDDFVVAPSLEMDQVGEHDDEEHEEDDELDELNEFRDKGDEATAVAVLLLCLAFGG